jgi:hypothetical protein
MKARLDRALLFLAPLLFAPALVGQSAKASAEKSPPDVPAITQRSYVGGSAHLTTTGAFQVDAEVPINAKASYSDGEKTWLQFGASGAKEPNVLITYGDGDIGIIFASGTFTATAEAVHCTGRADVTAASITGQYRCKGVTAYDKSSGKMNPVAVTVTFTAKS